MSLVKQFKTNTDKELSGVPIQFAPNDDGTIPTFIVARMGRANKRYTTEMTRLTKPWQRLIASGQLSDEKSDEIVMQAFINTVLLGWENVQVETKAMEELFEQLIGTTIPFTKDNAKKLFVFMNELYDHLLTQSQQAVTFLIEELDDAAKNS